MKMSIPKVIKNTGKGSDKSEVVICREEIKNSLNKSSNIMQNYSNFFALPK
jgi:hypothetical protein